MLRVIRLIALVSSALGIVAWLQSSTGSAETRRALSVGIDVYANLAEHQQLKTAVNDARAMGASLRALGFETAVEENIGKLAFTRAWQRFLNRLEPGDTAALFFAGHGVEIGGLNFLLPGDVPKVELREDRVLAEASIRFNVLMEDLRDKNVRVALFIVDACRDNPFRDSGGRSVGGRRGLARVEPAKGSFVMYSAGAGEEALDRLPGTDPNPNSVYTRTLLPVLATPNLSLPDIATRVRERVVEVSRAVGREQTPAYYDQIVGKFILRPGAGDVPSPKPETAPPPQPSAAALEWARVDKTSIAELETFSGRHPTSPEAEYARARAEALKKQLASVAPPPAPPSQPAPVIALAPRSSPPPQSRHCARAGSGETYCASSVLAPQFGNTYGPSHLFDGDEQTAWVHGRSGTGVGSWVAVIFDRRRVVQSIDVLNGYTKNRDIFSKNTRIRRAQLRFPDGQVRPLELADSMSWQTIPLSPPVEAEWVQLEILDVYRGWKYVDTAISELRVNAR